MSKNTNLSFLTDYITADITNGRIGINNASPAYAFDVTGIARTSTSTYLATASGNVGIGTTSPDALLTVAGANQATGAAFNTYGNVLIYSTDSYAQNKGGALSLGGKYNSAGTPIATFARIHGKKENATVDSTSGYLSFETVPEATATLTEAMRINSIGNIGIGTNAPAGGRKLTVAGGVQITTGDNSGASFNIVPGATGQAGADFNLSYYTGTGFGPLTFTLGGSERMRITSGGSMLMAKDAAIGINTSDGADNGYLALCGASADGENRGGYIYLSGNERVSDPGMVVIGAGNVIGIGSVIAFRTGAGVERMRLIGNGRLLIGTSTDQGYLLFVNGNAAGTSGFANVSDIRLKKDITPIKNGLDKINRLNGVSFNWDKTLRPDLNVDDNNHLGLIAQDVEEILPQVIITGDDEFNTKTIIYSDIVPVLIEAIKELSKEINLLKQK